MKILAIVLLLTTFTVNAQAQSIDLMIKARGLQAMERIEKLSKKNGNSKGKNLSAQDHCDWNLEGSYLAFTIPETSKIVNKQEQKKINGELVDIFILIIKEEGSELFQLNYSYKSKTKKVDIAEIRALPKDWRVMYFGDGNAINISSDKCIYSFNSSNPLDSVSVAFK